MKNSISKWTSKTIRDLEYDLLRALRFVNHYPKIDHSLHLEYIRLLERHIAERLGR